MSLSVSLAKFQMKNSSGKRRRDELTKDSNELRWLALTAFRRLPALFKKLKEGRRAESVDGWPIFIRRLMFARHPLNGCLR
jgi:hypothetical protein